MQHTVCPNVIAKLLRKLGYSLQSNRKTREGSHHPDRDAQFQYLAGHMKEHLSEQSPVISVDTKKKELVGDFKNAGRELRPTASPEEVRVHDFIDPELGRAVPYGIYDIADNKGWVSVGVDHDTAEFAVNSLRLWWEKMGCLRYPKATCLLLTADGGGSNGSRLRLWKRELQAFVEETGLAVTVCHYPPGTSKWNKIEHRLFSFISSNWRGEPLRDYETVVQLIAKTTTATGLAVTCRLDRRKYPTGRRVTTAEMQGINLVPDRFHGEWNYVIGPRMVRVS